MEALNAADWVMIIVVAISTLISLLRGFVREAISVTSWVLALVISLVFSDRFAILLSGQISDPMAAFLVAFAILFIATLLMGVLTTYLLKALLSAVGLTGLDRTLGTIFGFARGVLILLAMAVFLRPALGLDQYQWWRTSALLPDLLMLEGWFRWLAELIREAMSALWQ